MQLNCWLSEFTRPHEDVQQKEPAKSSSFQLVSELHKCYWPVDSCVSHSFHCIKETTTKKIRSFSPWETWMLFSKQSDKGVNSRRRCKSKPQKFKVSNADLTYWQNVSTHPAAFHLKKLSHGTAIPFHMMCG